MTKEDRNKYQSDFDHIQHELLTGSGYNGALEKLSEIRTAFENLRVDQINLLGQMLESIPVTFQLDVDSNTRIYQVRINPEMFLARTSRIELQSMIYKDIAKSIISNEKIDLTSPIYKQLMYEGKLVAEIDPQIHVEPLTIQIYYKLK